MVGKRFEKLPIAGVLKRAGHFGFEVFGEERHVDADSGMRVVIVLLHPEEADLFQPDAEQVVHTLEIEESVADVLDAGTGFVAADLQRRGVGVCLRRVVGRRIVEVAHHDDLLSGGDQRLQPFRIDFALADADGIFEGRVVDRHIVDPVDFGQYIAVMHAFGADFEQFKRTLRGQPDGVILPRLGDGGIAVTPEFRLAGEGFGVLPGDLLEQDHVGIFLLEPAGRLFDPAGAVEADQHVEADYFRLFGGGGKQRSGDRQNEREMVELHFLFFFLIPPR